MLTEQQMVETASIRYRAGNAGVKDMALIIDDHAYNYGSFSRPFGVCEKKVKKVFLDYLSMSYEDRYNQE